MRFSSYRLIRRNDCLSKGRYNLNKQGGDDMAEREVKVIQPTIGIIKEQRLQRAAAYCRVSTDSDDQANSFSAQLKYYTEYINMNPKLEFVDIYADEGITGTCINKRDEFKRMMKDASNGRIDRLFVKSVSRFARNSLECIESIRLLKSFGVTVLFENDNIDTNTMNSELILYVKSAFAQSEALAGSKRLTTAYRMKMENGSFITYNAPFGYKLDKENHLLIVPEEVETVKLIYDLYLSGMGTERIAEYLNVNSISKRERVWNVSAIRYILTNEKYIGDSLLQKTYTPQMLPLRNIPNKGELDKYYVTNTHEAIIDKEVFELVQQRMKQNTNNNKSASVKHFFTGMIECGECGWTYKRKKQNDVVYWVCSRKKNAGYSCNGKSIREDEIYSAFIYVYNKLRCFEQEIIDKTLHQLLTLREKVSINNREISQIDIELSKLCEKINSYAQLHTKGVIDEISYLERTSELKYKTTELRNKRSKLLSMNDDGIVDRFKNLKEILSEYPKTILEFDKQLFTAIIDKIKVGSDNRLIFRVKGNIELEYRR